MGGAQAMPLADTPQAQITPEQGQIRRGYRTPGRSCCASAQGGACKTGIPATVRQAMHLMPHVPALSMLPCVNSNTITARSSSIQ